jgi:hypothetical protein
MTNTKSSRRAFFLQGGAVLGAGVATAAAATPAGNTQPLNEDLRTLQQQLALAQDREAIRQLHLAFAGRVEDKSLEVGQDLFIVRLRPNHLQQKDALVLTADGLQATATYHVDVALGTPLLGDSTVAQMARLQGQMASLRWESGRIEARYVKSKGQWKVASLDYQSSGTSNPLS